jgi:hypothetical protein
MRTLALGNRGNGLAIKVDGDASGSFEQFAISLEPARPARVRQDAIGNDDVGQMAGGC